MTTKIKTVEFSIGNDEDIEFKIINNYVYVTKGNEGIKISINLINSIASILSTFDGTHFNVGVPEVY